MRFFSKITVICNCCFILSVVFWYIEMQKQKHGDGNLAIPLPWLENTLVILGYGAIIVNALFLILYFIFSSFKMNTAIPRWMIIFNIIIFCCQVYFHFIFK
ncbi:MAG: hypothetical protein BWZ05_02283 [Bacteroidetes bacterium ADurb.BinA245]|nr:hypothetical protein [Bacteroidota bacterium]MBX2919634.1 hypothetical protein [Ferruginibacter sp.]MCB0708493.1 hypothetical protein [Chitinophagaceae bacterium]OPZ15223.1 MAG: hypothetical protein BWZ05_02283 [Bacteroidetes bacterium ADurb.BinA245]